MQKLIFGQGNAKLSKTIFTFSLPAGFTCPAALKCQSFADRQSGKITDGKDVEFRCFAASQESAFPSVRSSRWHNFELLKPIRNNSDAMKELILLSLDSMAKIVRIHVSGDFFNDAYFLSWIKVAQCRPETVFYAYTKSLISVYTFADLIPDNFVLTLSHGGKHDDLMKSDVLNRFKTAKVVLSETEAEILGIEIDHDDSHAISGNENFALLIHGTQPAKSSASKAIKELKAKGTKFSYSTKK